MKQVGHHQQRLGNVQKRRRRPLHGQKLIQRVELHELQTGLPEDFLPRHDGESSLQHAVVAAVAIMIGIAQQLVASPQQAEIDAPGIDADAHYLAAGCNAGRQQPPLHVRPEAGQVPV